MFTTKKPLGAHADMTDPLMWSRIRLAPLPATRDGREFHRALAQSTDLPLADAREVEAEYRRFLYLAATTQELRVAPPQVRTAWQMHAQHPDYEPFCAGVLGKPLPLDDSSRMLGASTAYAATRTAYLREFNENPPALHWPEGMAPRLPRWLPAHIGVLAVAAALALGHATLLYLALGVGLSLALYGVDLYLAHLGRRRDALGDRVSDDLSYFLDRAARR